MVTVQDVIRAVAGRGGASLDDLERILGEDGLELIEALDACVDHGYLAVRGPGPGLDLPYRVTRRGRKMLRAGSQAMAAA